MIASIWDLHVDSPSIVTRVVSSSERVVQLQRTASACGRRSLFADQVRFPRMTNPYEPPRVDEGTIRSAPLKFTLSIGFATLVWFSFALVDKWWFCFASFPFGSFVGILIGPVRTATNTLRSSYICSFLIGSLFLFIFGFEYYRKEPLVIFSLVVASATLAFASVLVITGCIALYMRLMRHVKRSRRRM